METHALESSGHWRRTLQWLEMHGHTGVFIGPSALGTPVGMGTPIGLLFRPQSDPNEPPKLAVVGDTLVADGRVVTIVDPTLKGLI